MTLGDVAYYIVNTGNGSTFYVKFKLTHYLEAEKYEKQFPCGDLVITGYSNLVQKEVSFCGLGFIPEVGGYLAVEEYDKDEDGMSLFHKELITEIIII